MQAQEACNVQKLIKSKQDTTIFLPSDKFSKSVIEDCYLKKDRKEEKVFCSTCDLLSSKSFLGIDFMESDFTKILNE